MSLPTPWVDRIFDKLTLTYGQSFLRRWTDIDLNAVKSDWAHELSGFQQCPRAISWALQNLPADSPPTVLQFKFLARRAPPDEIPRLESPPADPGRVAEELAKLAPVLAKPIARANTDWAYAIVAKAQGGLKVSPLVLRMAKDVVDRRNPGVVTVEGKE